MKKATVSFNKSSVAKKLFEAYAKEQTRRLIEYAIEETTRIGDEIQRYPSGNHMYRTANLLDSLCWGVSYNGKLEDSGFYQNQQATKLSYLHEWNEDNDQYPVGGHVLAANFIKQMGNLKSKGWRMFIAIIAPYWGYWEKGFKIRVRTSGSDEDSVGNTKFLKWAIMTKELDRISKDFSPIVPKFSVTVDTSKRWKPRKDTGYSKNDRNQKYPRGIGKGLYDF